MEITEQIEQLAAEIEALPDDVCIAGHPMATVPVGEWVVDILFHPDVATLKALVSEWRAMKAELGRCEQCGKMPYIDCDGTWTHICGE